MKLWGKVSVLCFLILFAFTTVIAGENVIINGGFDSGLSGWDFENISRTGSVCASWGDYAWSEAYEENGEVVIHTRYGYGRGKIYQGFNPVKPKKLSVDYRAFSPSGHCNSVLIYFYDPNGNKIAGLYYGEDSFVPEYSIWRITLIGTDHRLSFNSKYSEGTIEFEFDWDKKEATAVWHSPDGTTEELVSEPIESDVYVSKVELIVYNSCCDGRNDAYGYFDNVIVEPVEQVESNNGNSNPQLLAHYSFNHCDGRDSSDNGFDGEVIGNPECVSGVKGSGAFNLDGNDDWIKVDHIFSLKDFTISLWFKTSSDEIQGLLQMTDGHRWGLTGVGIVLLNSDDLEIGYRAEDYGDKCEIHAKGMGLADNRWHMVTLVRNTSVGKGYLYIDGQLVGSCEDPDPDKVIVSQSYLRIGYGYYYRRGYYLFKGYLDDVKIYNYPLTSAEIFNLYQYVNNFNENNVGNYTLNVTKNGSGRGTVISSPSGISCGSFCSVQFRKGTYVTLTAEADSDSKFVGWDGDCFECGNNTVCSIVMDSTKNCVGKFKKLIPDIKIIHLYYEKNSLFNGKVHFICKTSQNDISDGKLKFIWEFRKAGSSDVKRVITNKNDVFYKFNELANYEVTCKISISNYEMDEKSINFPFNKFLVELYAPVLLFSMRGDKADPQTAEMVGFLISQLENLLPPEIQLAFDLTEEAVFKRIPEYEYFYPTSIDNFLNHLLPNGCLDKNYLEEVKGNIDKQQPLTVYYYLKDIGNEIILEYWMFYIYNEILDYPSNIIDYIPFNHQGDWEGVVFIINKTDYSIAKGIFYKHKGYKEVDSSQISYIYYPHPNVYIALGTHASYPNAGVDPVLDRHFGEFIKLYPSLGGNQSGNQNRTYILSSLESITPKLVNIYKWGCSENSPASPLYQEEKLTDPESWLNKLQDKFPDPYLEEFRFYTEGNYIVLEAKGVNKGQVGIGYLSITLEKSDLSCSDIVLDGDASCYDKGKQIWCFYGEKKCVLNYPHIEKIKTVKSGEDIVLTVKIPKEKISSRIFYVDLKFITSDQSGQHWTYAPHIENILPFCTVIDQQSEHALRTFVLSDGDYEKYLLSSYICYNTLYIPKLILYYKGEPKAFLGLSIDLSTFEVKTIKNIASVNISSNVFSQFSIVSLEEKFLDEIGQMLLKHVIVGDEILRAKFKIYLKKNAIRLDLTDYQFEK